MLQPAGSLNRSLFDTVDRNHCGVITWDKLEQALGSQSRASSGRKQHQHEFRPSTHTQTHTNTHLQRTFSTHRHTNMHLRKTDSKMHLQDTCHHGHTTRACASRQTHHHTRTTQHLPTHRSCAATILKNSEPFQHEPEAWRTFLGAVSLQSLLTSPRFMNSLPLSLCLCVGLGDPGLRTSAPRCLHVARDHLQGCNLGSLLRGARRCHLCQNALLWEAVPCRRSSRKSLCSAIRQR